VVTRLLTSDRNFDVPSFTEGPTGPSAVEGLAGRADVLAEPLPRLGAAGDVGLGALVSNAFAGHRDVVHPLVVCRNVEFAYISMI
jgi:hypothetical protein